MNAHTYSIFSTLLCDFSSFSYARVKENGSWRKGMKTLVCYLRSLLLFIFFLSRLLSEELVNMYLFLQLCCNS